VGIGAVAVTVAVDQQKRQCWRANVGLCLPQEEVPELPVGPRVRTLPVGVERRRKENYFKKRKRKSTKKKKMKLIKNLLHEHSESLLFSFLVFRWESGLCLVRQGEILLEVFRGKPSRKLFPAHWTAAMLHKVNGKRKSNKEEKGSSINPQCA